jgi:DNA mismatch repair protein MutS
LELPALLKAVGAFRSISVGINLGAGLEPAEATILSVGTKPYRGGGLAGRLLDGTGRAGIAPLHTAGASGMAANPLMVPLFRDLSGLLHRAVRPIAEALTAFAALSTVSFVALADEMLFYAGAARLGRRLAAAGLPVSRPDLRPADERVFSAQGLYNVDLAVRRLDGGHGAAVVASDSPPASARRVALVTGPNSGGKTTFLQAVGLAQILCQLGVFAPAAALSFSPADAILTHYPALETGEDGSGRFAEETRRLRDSLLALGPRSLMLMNESLSSTAMAEAVYIAQDVVCLLAEIGCRAVYVTHLHELAARCGEAALSLVAGAGMVDGEMRPTYRVEPGSPEGRSYAAALAARHGLELGALRRDRLHLAARAPASG